ncbi:MAG: citrate lyase ACP [Ignavibacteriaceae bacterium]|nr:MAG: citrate lyase ACP [Ignavibacteriaceae bacterium]MBW7872706.1 HpcH/HpaI aldolase/citrate lyase family protein [Ignavibacteria bacterium]OQY73497.1 MAG: citrate lyase ACP [Ignavibacteriales bacterium UTCHB3]MBV6444305.1 Citrate lyase acyl carrier protein [Ignavibacteriaceae bacterium]MBZ0196003.1 HpcH/HpaI aldolase/citrate lyase family protein [Ignavibacteriaceae bacterium]
MNDDKIITSGTPSASAGKRGTAVRSDCWIEITLGNGATAGSNSNTGNTANSSGNAESPDRHNSAGNNDISVKSKVGALYGGAIKAQLSKLADFFGIKGATISIEDAGALPFVIAARFEAAVKRLNPAETREYLPLFGEFDFPDTAKDRLRRSRLYLPGNEPKFFVNAGLHEPDGLILDLEDSVAPAEKDTARFLVRNALRCVNFYGAERMVRINQLPMGLEDLKFVIPHKVNLILIPKVEEANAVIEVGNEIQRLKEKHGINRDIRLMPIIESAKGAINAYKIAAAAPSVCSLAIGLEDYTADIGTERTLEGTESFWARMQVVNAAKAAGVQAIDSVFSDVADMEGLVKSTLESKSYGFEGKGCIHPRQIQPIHAAFAPTSTEIEKAKKIFVAFQEALAKGLAAVSIGSKMIDPPVVKRAEKVIELALLNGLIEKDWMVNYGND